MSNINAGFVDSIYTLQSSTTGGSPVILVPSDPNRRPFVCFARCAGAGSTIRMGDMVVHEVADTTYSGMTVGKKGDVVQHEGAGTAYLVTCGYFSKVAGDPTSGLRPDIAIGMSVVGSAGANTVAPVVFNSNQNISMAVVGAAATATPAVTITATAP